MRLVPPNKGARIKAINVGFVIRKPEENRTWRNEEEGDPNEGAT
jgi:hypothetical protein